MIKQRPQEYQIRRVCRQVAVGRLVLGGDTAVVVQAMTDTDTADVQATVAQCKELAEAGAELLRVTVNSPRAAQAVPPLRKMLDDMGVTVPLVGDFHYNGHKLLSAYPECAKALAKYRINPGNVGRGDAHDTHFAVMLKIAIDNGKAVRIGVNWGSLDQELLLRLMDENGKRKKPRAADMVLREALVQSALTSAAAAEKLGLADIVLSCKTSRIPDLLAVYRQLSNACDYPLHLGLTEAGMGIRGISASSAALAVLLAEGIGDTIRASLTPAPGGARTDEVKLCCELLQSLGLRSFTPQVTACPGCGRTTSDFFRKLACDIETHIKNRLPQWKKNYTGIEELKIAVMGCVVNGPGESRHADIGISLPGSGETPVAPVFIDGEKITALKGETIADDFIQMVEEYIAKRYG